MFIFGVKANYSADHVLGLISFHENDITLKTVMTHNTAPAGKVNPLEIRQNLRLSQERMSYLLHIKSDHLLFTPVNQLDARFLLQRVI